MTWDPDRYLQFADHRLRPGVELIARIDSQPATIVDLGSGTGEITRLLAERWPNAEVLGIDSSPEMVERARSLETDRLRFQLGDIAAWEPDRRPDLIFSNAALHWIDDHAAIFSRLRSHVATDGTLAVQMPDNWWEPTHRIPAEILEDFRWSDEARSALMTDRLSNPERYRDWLQPARIDMWRTTYFQELHGEDPVWRWTTGSLLRPVLDALTEDEIESFSAECRRRYGEAYPPQRDGTTVLPFTRLFMVAVAE